MRNEHMKTDNNFSETYDTWMGKLLLRLIYQQHEILYKLLKVKVLVERRNAARKVQFL